MNLRDRFGDELDVTSSFVDTRGEWSLMLVAHDRDESVALSFDIAAATQLRDFLDAAIKAAQP